MAKYFNYNNIILAENIIEFIEHIRMNNYIIKLEEDKQSFFKLIYSLGLIKLKMLKIYIKINLANGFIYFSKFFTRIFIIFNWKPDESFCLYVND